MQKVFGGILKACGILIAGVSGLCTLIAGGVFLGDGGGSEFFDFLSTILTVGGIPIAIGVGIYLLGRKMQESAGED